MHFLLLFATFVFSLSCFAIENKPFLDLAHKYTEELQKINGNDPGTRTFLNQIRPYTPLKAWAVMEAFWRLRNENEITHLDEYLYEPDQNGNYLWHQFAKLPPFPEKFDYFVNWWRVYNRHRDFNIDSRDRDGNTMLHLLFANNDPENLSYLVFGSRVDLRNRRDLSVIDYALMAKDSKAFLELVKNVETFDSKTVDILLESFFPEIPNFLLKNGRNAYTVLSRHRRFEAYAKSTINGGDLALGDKEGVSSIHYLAMYATEKELLEIENYKEIGLEKLKHIDSIGDNFILKAVRSENKEAVNWFLKGGHRLGAFNVRHPIFLAMEVGNEEILRLLLDYEPNLVDLTEGGRSIVHWVYDMKKPIEVKRRLLQSILEKERQLSDSTDNQGMSVFDLALEDGDIGSFLSLLKFFDIPSKDRLQDIVNRYDIQADEFYGTRGNILHHLIESSKERMVPDSLLREEVINQKNTDGKTPLFLATERKMGQFLLRLVTKGGDLSIFGPYGLNSLHLFSKDFMSFRVAPFHILRKAFVGDIEVNKLSETGKTYLFYALENSSLSKRLFFKYMPNNYDFRLRDKDGNNIFHYLSNYLEVREPYGSDDIKNLEVVEKILMRLGKTEETIEMLWEENENGDSPISVLRDKYKGIGNCFSKYLLGVSFGDFEMRNCSTK